MSDTQYHQKRTNIKKKLELIDLKLKDCFSGNSDLLIELQVERLKLLDKLRYLRPANSDDITYRERILKDFAFWGTENIPDDFQLIFHATTLANTERILNSGKVISGKDRWTIHTSSDDSGEISISTKDSLFISLAGHMDLTAQEGCLPAGCLFVFHTNKSEYKLAKKDQRVHNIYFRQKPEQLYAIVTSPENLKRVKWWMQKNNFLAEKVCDFESFKKKIEEDKIFFSCIKSWGKNK